LQEIAKKILTRWLVLVNALIFTDFYLTKSISSNQHFQSTLKPNFNPLPAFRIENIFIFYKKWF